MEDVPVFFMPHASAELAEAEYSAIAGRLKIALPTLNERIYSVGFTHDSNHWTATVGDNLRGSKRHESGRGRSKTVRFTDVVDSAKVLAIYDGGIVYFVVTDGGTLAGRPSGWANPFMAGKPAGITYFSCPPTSA